MAEPHLHHAMTMAGLELGGGNPFLHGRKRHDGAAVLRRERIEGDVLGAEASAHWCIHRVGGARLSSK
jgi:hypothetical protein